MDIGIPELLIILVIVIFLLGPGKVGKVLGELGSGIKSLKENFNNDKKELGLSKVSTRKDDNKSS